MLITRLVFVMVFQVPWMLAYPFFSIVSLEGSLNILTFFDLEWLSSRLTAVELAVEIFNAFNLAAIYFLITR